MRRALLIGNSTYRDPLLSQLVAPRADVEGLATVLADEAIGQFDKVTILHDEPKATVERAISVFFAECEREDTLLLYFSGHGLLDGEGRLHLAVVDTETKFLLTAGVSARTVRDIMDETKSRVIVLILDCCYGAAFERGTKGLLQGLFRKVVRDRVNTREAFGGSERGRHIMTASDATQFAYDGEMVQGQGQRSIFTRHLIDGLSSGDADDNGDDEITAGELFAYAKPKVEEESDQRQSPQWSSAGPRHDVVIAQNPNPSPQQASTFQSQPTRRLSDALRATISQIETILAEVVTVLVELRNLLPKVRWGLPISLSTLGFILVFLLMTGLLRLDTGPIKRAFNSNPTPTFHLPIPSKVDSVGIPGVDDRTLLDLDADGAMMTDDEGAADIVMTVASDDIVLQAGPEPAQFLSVRFGDEKAQKITASQLYLYIGRYVRVPSVPEPGEFDIQMGSKIFMSTTEDTCKWFEVVELKFNGQFQELHIEHGPTVCPDSD